MVQAVVIFNSLLINVFMLRVFHVAAVLKCQTKREEIVAEKRIKIIRLIYLPTFFILSCAIYSADVWLFSSQSTQSEVNLALLIILLNLIKECLTGTLGVYVLIFACRLRNIIDELVYEWGNSPPSIKRIKKIRFYLFLMGITFLTVDVVYNIAYPVFEAIDALKDTQSVQ